MKNVIAHGHTCPIAAVAALVGDTWTLLIIRDLSRGPQTFSNLAESLAGISTRTLTTKLRHLTANDIIAPRMYQQHPPRSRYELTPKGKELRTLIRAMERFGEVHLSSK